MKTKTFKLEDDQAAWLAAQKPTRGSESRVIRELIDEARSGGRPSLLKRMGKLAGSLRGPKDLSTRKLTGYGED